MIYGPDGKRFLTWQENADALDQASRGLTRSSRSATASFRSATTSFRSATTSFRSATTSFRADHVVQERDHVVQERDQIAQERDRIAQEREAERRADAWRPSFARRGSSRLRDRLRALGPAVTSTPAGSRTGRARSCRGRRGRCRRPCRCRWR